MTEVKVKISMIESVMDKVSKKKKPKKNKKKKNND